MSRKTRKLIWSVPLLAVLAVAGALAIFAAQTPNIVFAAPPDAPTTLEAMPNNTDGDDTIDLSWRAPSGADPAVTGYEIEVSTNKALSWSVLVANTGNTQIAYEDTGLEAGKQRHYRVSAINTDGTGLPSNIANATTWRTPDAPAELTATAASATEIGLAWEVPDNDGGNAVTGYKIEASQSASGLRTVIVAEQATTPYTHSNLSAGQTWHYWVSAINEVGAGTPATDMETTWKLPAAPTGFTAMPDSMAGATQIDLSWSKVSAPETEGAVTTYNVYAVNTGPNDLQSIDDETPSFTSPIADDASETKVGHQVELTEQTTSNVAAGQTWHIQVAAVNRAGIGPRSAVRVVKTWTLPGAPRGLTATAVSSTRVDLSWTAPTNTGGQGVKITGYLIERSINSAEEWPENLRHPTTNADTTYADTNAAVAANDTVHYRVSAMNGITVNGDTAGMVSNIALAGALDAPDAPTKLTAAAVSGTQIDLSWTAPKDPDEAPVTGYKIEHRATDDPPETPWSVLVADTESTDTTHMDMTLMNGDLRHYRVKAINKAGTGDPSDTAMATAWDKPAMPTMLPAKADGPSRIKLSWQPPPAGMTGGMDADGDDIPITGYKIEVSDDLGATWSVLQASYNGDADASAEGVQYNHVGLMAGDQRHYQVRAINAVGESDPSNIADATTDADAVVPGAPTGVTATSGTDGTSAMVTWMAPESNGGSAITGYKVMYRMTDSSADYMEMDAAAGATSATVTGLTAGGSYDIAVVATNGVGDSAMSDVFMVTVEAASMELMPPSGVMVEVDDSAGEASVTITWTDGPNADRHVVFLFDENFEVTPDRIAGNQTDGETTFDNVPSGTYTAVVVAVEDSDSGTFVMNIAYGVESVTVN